MIRKLVSCMLVLSIFLLMASCGGQKATGQADTATPAATEATTPAPTTPEATPEVPEPTIRPGYSADQTIFPIEKDGKRYPVTENDTGKILIETVAKHDFYPTSYMVVTKTGKIIIMDPSDMPTQKDFSLKPDLVTVTHGHQDHYDPNFINAVDDTAKIMTYGKTDDVTLDDVHVYSIASDHSTDNVDKEKPTNLIYVYELDGIRIANFGDCGQSKLTDEQLEQIGKIDILFTQLDNSFSSMYYKKDTKAKDVIAQINPKILIPTHGTIDYYKDIAQFFGTELETVDTILAVDPNELKDGKIRVIDIAAHQKY